MLLAAFTTLIQVRLHIFPFLYISICVGLLKVFPTNFQKLQNLDFNISGQTYSLTPNAQIWPQSINTVIGGDVGSIYLTVADAGAGSESGLDFINVPVGFLFTPSCGFLAVP